MFAVPFDFDGLRCGELRLLARAYVLQPLHATDDRVQHDVGQSIAIPVRDVQRRVAPLRFSGTLDALIACEHADGFAISLETLRRRPLRLRDLRAAEVLEELDVARRVAADDVGVAIAVPIKSDRRGERTALQRAGFLLEILRLLEDGRLVRSELARVLDEGHTSIFIATDEILVAVLVPIESHWRDHFQIHAQMLARRIGDANALRIHRRGACAGVLKIGEFVQELTAQQIEIAIAIEVLELRRGATEYIETLARCVDELRLVILRLSGAARVLDEVDPAMQRAVLPFAVGVPRIVPPVVAPVFYRDDEIERAIAIVVSVAPLIVPHLRPVRLRALRLMELRIERQLHFLIEAGPGEVLVFRARCQHAHSAIDITRHHIVNRFADELARLEHWHLVLRCIARRVLEEIHAIARLVWAGDDQIKVAIAIRITRHRPGPEPDAKIDREAGVVVGELLQGESRWSEQSQKQGASEHRKDSWSYARAAVISSWRTTSASPMRARS